MSSPKSSLMLRVTVAVLIFVGLGACQQPKMPSPPIPMAKMEKILLDLQLAETYSLGLGDSIANRFTKNKDSLAVFYQAIFDHHQITADSFVTAMKWYKNYPALTDSLFTGTLDRLNQEMARLNIQTDNLQGGTDSPEPQTSSEPATDTLTKEPTSISEGIRDSVTQLLAPRKKPELKNQEHEKE